MTDDRIDNTFVRKCVLALSIVTTLFAGVAIRLYGSHAEDWLNGLDGQIGEIGGQRADTLARNGLSEDAIVHYRKALDLEFDDPMQRVWVGGRFLELLLQEQQYDEAVDVARGVLARIPTLTTHEKLTRALRLSGREEERVEAARAWAVQAQESNKDEAYALAKFQEGTALGNLDRPEEALDAFIMGFEASELPKNGRAAAEILIQQRRFAEALPLLDAVINSGHPSESKTAQRLRAQATKESRTP